MLSENAKTVAYELRLSVGPDSVGIGPDTNELIAICGDFDGDELLAAISELQRMGFINVDRAIPTSESSLPKPLRGIVAVSVLEPLQAYFDRIGI
ncbi:MAG: hypothetical protein ABL909_01360 [Sphingopyxis sp.]